MASRNLKNKKPAKPARATVPAGKKKPVAKKPAAVPAKAQTKKASGKKQQPVAVPAAKPISKKQPQKKQTSFARTGSAAEPTSKKQPPKKGETSPAKPVPAKPVAGKKTSTGKKTTAKPKTSAKVPVAKKPTAVPAKTQAKKASGKKQPPVAVPAAKPISKKQPQKKGKTSPAKPVPAKPPKKTNGRKKPKTKPTTSTISVRRDVETVQTKIDSRQRGATAYTPKELELMFERRGKKPLNLFDPETAGKQPPSVRKSVPAGKKPLPPKELPKAAPRKVGAVSLDDLFGYNPFAKNSVSAEEKQIPAKWHKYYKKLIALKTALQREIDEHSQTAFSRKNEDRGSEVSASYSQHTADIDNEAFTRDCALSLLATKQQELTEINIAIERMKKGTYGICEITGKPIPAERLRDVPFTRYSIEGKIEAEKQRKATARRQQANTATGIASATDIENDVPIVFNDDDEPSPNTAEPDPDEASK